MRRAVQNAPNVPYATPIFQRGTETVAIIVGSFLEGG